MTGLAATMSPPSRQRGAFLVMMAIMVVVLIAVAAFALDFGRVVALRAEMQNAVDAAALAGAAELDGKALARERAIAAAREALVHDSHYARIAELLGADSLPDAAFEFYCVIGSKNDVDVSDSGIYDTFCPGGVETETGSGQWRVADDGNAHKYAHYIRVRLDPALVAERFTVDLMFLPVLGVFGLDPIKLVSLNATAVAGRHYYSCETPPMMLCDPYEGTGTSLRYEMQPGQSILMRDQGGSNASWAPGNFGFLAPAAGNGAGNLAEELANPENRGCSPPVIVTSTGEVAQKTKAGINTRFDVYNAPPFKGAGAPADYPPAPNVVEYPGFRPVDPQGESFRTINGLTDRFGNGDWDFDGYWADKHGATPRPNGWNNATNRPLRAQVYEYEVNTASMNPQPPTHTAGVPERRELHVAVASCVALGIKGGGSTPYLLMSPDGFARMFLVRKANDPGNPAKLQIIGEYMGWAEETDAKYHVDIQLYQ